MAVNRLTAGEGCPITAVRKNPDRPSLTWYTPELHQMKSCKRQLERLCKKTGLTVHVQAYTDYLQQYKDALATARSSYYSNLIHSDSINPKALFSTINKLLKPIDNTSSTFNVNKCNCFLSFFQTTIDTIYSNLTTSPALSCFPPVSRPLYHSNPVSVLPCVPSGAVQRHGGNEKLHFYSGPHSIQSG